MGKKHGAELRWAPASKAMGHLIVFPRRPRDDPDLIDPAEKLSLLGADGRCGRSGRRGSWLRRLGCWRRTTGTERSGALAEDCASWTAASGSESRNRQWPPRPPFVTQGGLACCLQQAHASRPIGISGQKRIGCCSEAPNPIEPGPGSIPAPAGAIGSGRAARCQKVGRLTLDPDTAEPSGAVLRKVSRAHDGMAGVYGAVLVEGTVHRGDAVELLS